MLKRLTQLSFFLVSLGLLLPVLLIAQDTSVNRFTLVVIPDTQYLFDQDRGNPDVLAADLQWIIDHTEDRNIVFTAFLGDMVENALPEEFAQLNDVIQLLDDNDIQYSFFAGNHDLSNSGQYDAERSDEPYLEYFSPERLADNPTFGGASDNGFNTYFTFQAAGQEWLLLALDWQASVDTLSWAQGVIDEHPTLPVILTTHQLVDDDGSGTGQAYLTDYGSYLWDNLIANNDQIFLTLNGHYWPPARMVMQNNAGNDVQLHLSNYQDRYYGGAGMLRLYEFDLDRNVIEVSTIAPWVQAKPTEERVPLDVAELNDPTNRFDVVMNFADRFSGFNGDAPAEVAEVAAEDVVIDGTVAYWRFDGENTPAGEALADDVTVPDLSGNGNDLSRVTLANGKATDLIWTDDYAPGQPSRGSIYLNGAYRNPSFGGAYLRTADDAMLNSQTFEDGYTIEAFIRLPADCCGSRHAWMGVLSRLGTGGDIGQTEGDSDEPVVQLAISPGRQVQWAIRTTTQQDILTNWSHEVEADVWHHFALVNDGQRTIMYIDGSENLRNPRAESIGLATNGQYWVIGGGHYANIIEQSFYGWLGDVRIVDRPLDVSEFMTAR